MLWEDAEAQESLRALFEYPCFQQHGTGCRLRTEMDECNVVMQQLQDAGKNSMDSLSIEDIHSLQFRLESLYGCVHAFIHVMIQKDRVRYTIRNRIGRAFSRSSNPRLEIKPDGNWFQQFDTENGKSSSPASLEQQQAFCTAANKALRALSFLLGYLPLYIECQRERESFAA